MNNSKNIQKGGFIHAHDFLKKIISIGFEFETQSTTFPLVYDDVLKTYRQFHSKDNVLNFNCEVLQNPLPLHSTLDEQDFSFAVAVMPSATAIFSPQNNKFELQLTQDTPEIEVYFEPENIKIENLQNMETLQAKKHADTAVSAAAVKPPSKERIPLRDESKTITIQKNLIAELEFIITFRDFIPSNNIIKDTFKIACQSIYTFIENMTEYKYDIGYCLFSNEVVSSQSGKIEHEKYIILSALQKNQINFAPQCTVKIKYDDIIGFFVYFLLDMSYYHGYLNKIIDDTNIILDIINKIQLISELSDTQHHKLKTWIFIYIYYLAAYKEYHDAEYKYFKNHLLFALRHTIQEIFPNFGPQNQSIINVLKEAFKQINIDGYFNKLFGDQPTNTKYHYDFGDGILINNEITFFPYEDENILIEYRLFRNDIIEHDINYKLLNNYSFKPVQINFGEFDLFIPRLYSRIPIPNINKKLVSMYYMFSLGQIEILQINFEQGIELHGIHPLKSKHSTNGEGILHYLMTQFNNIYTGREGIIFKNLYLSDDYQQDYQQECSVFFQNLVFVSGKNESLIKYFNPFDVYGIVLIQIMKIIIKTFEEDVPLLHENNPHNFIHNKYVVNTHLGKDVADLLMELFRGMALLYDAILKQKQDTPLSVIWWLNKNLFNYIDRIKQHKQHLAAQPAAASAAATSGGYLNNWFHHCY